MLDDQPDVAGMMIPPPLMFAGPLAIGLLLHRRFPRPFLPPRLARVLGGILFGLSFFFGPPAFLAMRRAHTGVRPDEPSTVIVDSGPFRYSRNPIYVSFMLIYTGIATFLNAGWALLLLPFALVGIRRHVIEREEPYLERTFGASYVAYTRRVRRWI
jgi:protein-S-isoprenylcysteine O-methyltransferase Ste14